MNFSLLKKEGKEETYRYEDTNCIRIDAFCHALHPEFTLSKIRKIIKDCRVTLNEEKVKPNKKLHINDIISIDLHFPEESLPQKENLNLQILYEDEYLAMINKPPNITVHPAPGNYQGTIVHGILYQFKELSLKGGVERAGIVHRLDKETSGVLLVAKNEMIAEKLSALFQKRLIKKVYQGVQQGILKEKSGTVSEPLGRSLSNRTKMAIRYDKGREAETAYKVLQESERYRLSFTEFYPKTGRTHQIRVHAKFLNCPILGDKKYSSGKHPFHSLVTRHLLHAYKMSFIHPVTKKEIQVTAPHFEEFSCFLKKIFGIPPEE